MKRKKNILLYMIFIIGITCEPSSQVSVAAEDYKKFCFGAKNRIWPSMWSKGLSYDDSSAISHQKKKRWKQSTANLDRYKSDGFVWNVVEVHQKELGNDNGDYDFKRLNRVVLEHQKRNIDIAFRLLLDSKYYNNPAEKPSGKFGYHQGLYEFTKILSDHYKGVVKYYLIENELDHSARLAPEFNLTYDKYAKVLDSAYKGIKDGDNEALVMNHGPSGFGLGLAVAAHLLDTGKKEEAINFYDQYFKDPFHKEWPNTTKELHKRLNKKDIVRQLNFVNESLNNFDNYDIYQFHNYQNWKSLDQVMRWIKMKMVNAGKQNMPIVSTEIGYRSPYTHSNGWGGGKRRIIDYDNYKEIDHAESLIKKLTILASHGSTVVHYWPYRWWSMFEGKEINTVSLYKSSDEKFIERDAIKAIRFFINQFNCKKLIINKVDLDDETAVLFKSKTEKTIVIWSNKDKKTFKTDQLGQVENAFDIFGEKLKIVKDSIELGRLPIYLQLSVD